MLNINWYPGHMKKTSESIKNNLKQVDIVLELIDARAPKSSQNPLISELVGDKAKIIIFNKIDLADPKLTDKWMNYYKDKGEIVVGLNSATGQGISSLNEAIDHAMKDKRARDKERGIISNQTKAMVIGVPNVGKSTLINTLAGRRSAGVGARPGFTKQNQWIRIGDRYLLLDTQGVLWPRFESQELALDLAFIGSISDDVIPTETIALKLIEKLSKIHPEGLEERYGIDVQEDPLETMDLIGKRRGALMSGGYIDYTRVTDIVLDEFRRGLLGRITLEDIDV